MSEPARPLPPDDPARGPDTGDPATEAARRATGKRTPRARKAVPGAVTVRDSEWAPSSDPATPRGAAKYGVNPGRAELDRRIEAIQERLVWGWRRLRILQWVADATDWDSSPRTVDSYIHHATKRLAARAQRRIRYRWAQALDRLDEVAARGLETGNLSAVIRATREGARLLSLAERITPPTVPLPDDIPPPPSEDDKPARTEATTLAERADRVAALVKLAADRQARAAVAGTPASAPPTPAP